jgi:hypothetical protein
MHSLHSGACQIASGTQRLAMRPFSTDRMLDLEIVSELTWGAPSATPRS